MIRLTRFHRILSFSTSSLLLVLTVGVLGAGSAPWLRFGELKTNESEVEVEEEVSATDERRDARLRRCPSRYLDGNGAARMNRMAGGFSLSDRLVSELGHRNGIGAPLLL